MKIAIPSYNRPDVKLDILKEFNPKDIYVFVNNYSEKDITGALVKYKSKLPPEINIVPLMTKGIPSARNGILNYFEKGEQILMIDDDIDEVLKPTADPVRIKKTLTTLSPKEVKEFVYEAFRLCEMNNTRLW